MNDTHSTLPTCDCGLDDDASASVCTGAAETVARTSVPPDQQQEFRRVLYEALLVAYGKILAGYDAFTQASILRDVGQELISYLGDHGFPFEEKGDPADLGRLTELFVRNGFATKLEAAPTAHGTNYTWHGLYGRTAYQALHEVSDNPFLACPLNLGLYYLADKHGKTMKLHRKNFAAGAATVESEYEVVDQAPLAPGDADPLVVENARLYQLAEERARRLERARKELSTLSGILPICSCCKRIRDDENNWQQVEEYVGDRTDADFTHSYCPECTNKLRDDIERLFAEQAAPPPAGDRA